MDSEQNVGILRSLFVSMAADATLRLGNEGLIEKVRNEKRKNQLMIGKANAALFKVKTPEESFKNSKEVLNCANWDVISTEVGFVAEATSCKLCALAKSYGAQSPCGIYCIDIHESIIKSIESNATLYVKDTLWGGKKCIVEVLNCK